MCGIDGEVLSDPPYIVDVKIKDASLHILLMCGIIKSGSGQTMILSS